MDTLPAKIQKEIENINQRLSGLLSGDLEGAGEGAENFNLYSPQPGHPDWDDMRKRADDLADEALKVIVTDGGTVDETLAEARRISDALSVTGRSFMKNVRRFKKGNHTLLPPYFIWTMHNTCNFRCDYCDNHRGEKYFELPARDALDTEQGKKLLDVCRKNVTGIYFCGGEPTLRKDLPELLDYAHSINYFPLMINTNGSRIHKMIVDPLYSKFLKQMDIIIVSLDALNIGALGETWGVAKETCEQVIVNILALRKLQKHVRFKLMVNTVVTPKTVGEANSILDWANDLGIWYSPVPMNCGPVVNSELMEAPAYRELAKKILERKKQGYKILGSERLIKRLLKGDAIKCYPSLKPHVDPDGSLLWPCKAVANFEPARINLLNYNSFDEAYAAAADIVSVDNFHGHAPEQCGADCNWMQNYVSDIYARGIEKPIRSGVLLEIAEFVGAV